MVHQPTLFCLLPPNVLWCVAGPGAWSRVLGWLYSTQSKATIGLRFASHITMPDSCGRLRRLLLVGC